MRGIGWAGLLWLLPLGCSQPDVPEVDVRPYRRYLEQAESTWCEALTRCCTPAAQGCLSVQAGVRDPEEERAIRLGELRFDPEEAARCLASFQATVSGCETPFDVDVLIARRCDRAFSPTLRFGQACRTPHGCGEGSFCALNEGSSGECAYHHGPDPDEEPTYCADSTRCPPGQVCAGGVCLASVGQSCASESCQSLACDSSTLLCGPARTVGQVLCGP